VSLLEEYKAANPLVHMIHNNNASVVNIPECQLNWKIKLNGFCSCRVSVSVHACLLLLALGQHVRMDLVNKVNK
jgi:hypothetical protein